MIDGHAESVGIQRSNEREKKERQRELLEALREDLLVSVLNQLKYMFSKVLQD